MPLNCLIFQDDIARLNTTLEQARTGATLIGETLAKKKLKSNLTKSRYVLLGGEEFKKKTRLEAQNNSVMMGSHIMEESQEEKYLGDMIHANSLAASILITVNKRLGVLIGKINFIMNFAEHPQMYGLKNGMVARTLYEAEVVKSLLKNRASSIGLTDEIINTLQDFQNKFMLRFFEAPKQGTPTGIVELDSNMLLMKNRLLLSKLT